MEADGNRVGDKPKDVHVRVVVKRPFREHFVSGQRTDNRSGTLNPPINTVEGVFRGRGGFQRVNGQVLLSRSSISINFAQIWESWARRVILKARFIFIVSKCIYLGR